MPVRRMRALFEICYCQPFSLTPEARFIIIGSPRAIDRSGDEEQEL